ncbi:hypothetical protein [Streptomyces sp. ODS28]|uniref:hypothetical protein n=1 Tax=Streptomyces sp. ODS28 TaxID=3136688 RepID=UPI0031E68C69
MALRQTSRTVPAAAVALLVLAGAFAGGMAYAHKGPKTFSELSNSGCSLLAGDARSTLDSLVPEAHAFAVSEDQARGGDHGTHVDKGLDSRCRVLADGRTAVTAEATDRTTYADFADWETRNTRRIGKSGRERLHAFGGGYSTPTTAALYVPCKAKDPGSEPRTLSVLVTRAPALNDAPRSPMVTLAEKAARQAQTVSYCT